MKANELRIGNYVKSNDVNMAPYFIVTASFLKQNENEMSWFIDPIKLTEEWLLKLGFKYNDNIGLYQNGGFDVDIEDDVYCHFYMNDYGDWYKYIEYVHQLQNLYFALTGEELTVEL
jgi:hypothetical protein